MSYFKLLFLAVGLGSFAAGCSDAVSDLDSSDIQTGASTSKLPRAPRPNEVRSDVSVVTLSATTSGHAIVKNTMWTYGADKLFRTDLRQGGAVGAVFRALKPSSAALKFDRLMTVSSHEIAVTFRAEDGSAQEILLVDTNDAAAVVKDIGKELMSCVTVFGETFCTGMTVTQVIRKDHLLIVNGDQNNVAFSANEGQSWKFLLGAVGSDGCLGGDILPLPGNLLSGGECPLDSMFIRSMPMTVAADSVSLGTPTTLVSHATPVPGLPGTVLGNRRVMSLTSVGDHVVVAGCEGCVLASTDGGATFTTSIFHPLQGQTAKYPYYYGAAGDEKLTAVIGELDSSDGTKPAKRAQMFAVSKTPARGGSFDWIDQTVKQIKAGSIVGVTYVPEEKAFVVLSRRPATGPMTGIALVKMKLTL